MSNQGWIGVDLDGTLAYYGSWESTSHIGYPIPMMVNRVKAWLAEGKIVKIMTARVCSAFDEETRETARKAIQAWCLEYLGQELEVTSEKDYQMISLWDDRAVRIEHNTGKVLSNYPNQRER